MQQSEIANDRDRFAIERKYAKSRANAMNALHVLLGLMAFTFLGIAPALVILVWKAAL